MVFDAPGVGLEALCMIQNRNRSKIFFVDQASINNFYIELVIIINKRLDFMIAPDL